MFASHEIVVHLPYEVAAARLMHLVNWGMLHNVSKSAYADGSEMLVRVGPFGDVLGLSKLVRVHVLTPARRQARQTISLRWEATGPAGELFPVLDADLTLTADGAERCRLELIGTYRPPLGRAGAAVDRVIMNRVAAATIRSLLDNIAGIVTESAQHPRIAPADPRWRSAAEPGQA